MPSKIDKKGDHEPKAYFEGDGALSATEKITEQRLSDPEKLTDLDIENLTSKLLVNKIYYKLAKKNKREHALKIAAGAILRQGQTIKKQLDKNDLEINGKKDKENQNNKLDKTDIKTESKTNLTNSTEKAGKSDIPKISGGTLSEVISKISEMLAGKSGADLVKGSNNFSALIETLAIPEMEKKFDDTMKHLAKDPVLVAGISDILKETLGGKIFDQAIERNFTDNQKEAVKSVSKDILQSRDQENIEDQLSNKGVTK